MSVSKKKLSASAAGAAPTGPKYPHVKVRLVGKDGNAFFILARVRKAMEQAKVPDEEWQAFRKEATSGDYYHLLATVMKWVDAS